MSIRLSLFLNQSMLGAIFAQIFRKFYEGSQSFSRILYDFARILWDFVRIFTKLLEVRLHPLRLLHLWRILTPDPIWSRSTLKRWLKVSALVKFTHSSTCFKNYFQVFWKGFTCQCMSMKDTVSRHNARCLFFTWVVTPYFAPSHRAQKRLSVQSEPTSWFHERYFGWKKLSTFFQYINRLLVVSIFCTSITLLSTHLHAYIDSKPTNMSRSTRQLTHLAEDWPRLPR